MPKIVRKVTTAFFFFLLVGLITRMLTLVTALQLVILWGILCYVVAFSYLFYVGIRNRLFPPRMRAKPEHEQLYQD